MKNKLKLSTLSLLIFLLFSSCFGYTVESKSYAKAKFLSSKAEYPKKGWKKMEVFKFEKPTEPYEVISKIIITGNEGASEAKLLRKMKREAGRYGADAVIYTEKRRVPRTSADGFSATINLINAFSSSDDCGCCDEDSELDTGGDYEALEIEGVAIKFKGLGYFEKS